MTSLPSPHELTNNLEAAAHELSSGSYATSDTDRQRLLGAAKALVEQLEGPELGIWRVIFGGQAQATLMAAYEIGIFQAFDANIPARTAATLAETTGAEELLIVRIMRALVCTGIFREIGENTYAHNERSKMFTNPSFRTDVGGLAETFCDAIPKLPSYLCSISLRNPVLAQGSLFQYAHQTELSFFEWLHQHPDRLEKFSAFNAASGAMSRNEAATTVARLLPPDDDTQDANQFLTVDVGCGSGKILEAAKTLRPNLVGRMVAQDLKGEIEMREPSDVEGMVHDFFTPQPIQGANIYFFRHIFHDFPDSACLRILQNTIPALARQSSKIIIMDIILPNTGASLFGALLDITMMPLSSMERTERQWRDLIQAAGLKVVSIESIGSGEHAGVIIASLD